MRPSIPAASTPGRGSTPLPAPRGQGVGSVGVQRLGRLEMLGLGKAKSPGRGPSGSHAGSQAPGAQRLAPASGRDSSLRQSK